MSAQDKNAIQHFDAAGQESKEAEAPAGVEASIRGEEGVVEERREGEDRGAAKEGGVPADDEASGTACEWPSTSKSSQKPRKPHVTFSRNVVNQLVEIVEGPGTKNRRRIATGEAIGTTVGVLARPNMEKPREPEEISQERIGAILGPFRGAPPVNAPKPTHCRKSCRGGPCLPERCSCVLGEIKCSLDALCQCGPSNCRNYDLTQPVRDVVQANAVWREIEMPEANNTIKSVDSIPVDEAEEHVEAGAQEQDDAHVLDELADSFRDLSMVSEPLEEMPEGQEGGLIEKEDEGSMQNGAVAVEMGAIDRFVTRRRNRRVVPVEQSESGILQQIPRPPNNTQETPSKVKDFMCYWCGAMLSSKRDYDIHSLYHNLALISHQISGLEPQFRIEVESTTGHAAQVLNAPHVSVRRRVLKRKMEERSEDEPASKRRRIDSGSIIVVDDVEEGVSKDDGSADGLSNDQPPDDRFVTLRRKGRAQETVEAEGVDSTLEDDDDEEEMMEGRGEDVAGLEEPMEDVGIEERIEMEEEEEDEEEDEESIDSEDAEEKEFRKEIGRIAETLLAARIQEIPIEEARTLVAAIKTSRDGFGRIVIGEREDDDAIRADGVWFEGLGEMERVAGERLEELVRLVADDADNGEAPRFISNLGDRISLDRLDLDDAPFGETILDQMEDDGSNDVDGEDSEAGGDGDAEAGEESDDDVDAAAPPKHAISLEDERMSEKLLKMLPKMLENEDFESCTQDKCITTNALFCGLMQEASAKNKKEAKIGVLSPSVLKDWESGRKLKKVEIDELLFNRDPQLILIPIFQPARNFESGRIEHWSVGSYDVGACSVTIYDSIEPTKDEKGAVVELVKEFMNEWVGDDEARCVKYRYARKDRVEKQIGIENKSNSGLFVLLHARRLAQLEKDCSTRGRAPIDVKNERKELLKTMKTAKQEFEKVSGQNTPQQQQRNQRKRKLPALTTPDFIKARRDNSGTRERIRRCYRELKKRC